MYISKPITIPMPAASSQPASQPASQPPPPATQPPSSHRGGSVFLIEKPAEKTSKMPKMATVRLVSKGALTLAPQIVPCPVRRAKKQQNFNRVAGGIPSKKRQKNVGSLGQMPVVTKKIIPSKKYPPAVPPSVFLAVPPLFHHLR